MADTKLYFQFDGENVNGTRYNLGDEVPSDMGAAVTTLLLAQGRIAASKPVVSDALPLTDLNKPVADMSRDELEAAAQASFATQAKAASDDDLRKGILAQRKAEGNEALDKPADDKEAKGKAKS